MKTKIYLKTAIFAIAGFITLGSCVKSDDYETPQVRCTDNLGTVNHTLAELSAKAKQNATEADIISEDYVVEGYVASTDVTGNIYKQIFIQDQPSNPTVGFEIDVDNSYLYTDWPVGAKVKLNLKGLVVVKYNGANKIGQYDPTYQGAGQVGRINPTKLSKYMARQCGADGFPILATMVPKEFNSISAALASTGNINTLVKINNVQFNTPELTKNFTDVGGYASGYDRNIIDQSAGLLVLRISAYASFSSNAISPKYQGSGSVTMILSKYNSTPQGYIRGLSDLDLNGTRFSFDNLENFESYATSTDNFLPKYYNLSVTGSKKWFVQTYNSNKYLQISGLNAGLTKTQFAIPVADFAKTKKVSFKTNAGYYNGDVLKVYWSSNYNPATPAAATLNDITSQFDISKGKVPGGTGSNYEDAFRPSGIGNLPTGTTGSGYIIFEYNSNHSSSNPSGISTVMQLDDINIF